MAPTPPGGELRALVLAAGDGARLQPISSLVPKAALPVGNRPLVLHHLDALRRAGLSCVVIVVGAGGGCLRTLIEDDPDSRELSLQFVEQPVRRGIADAMKCAKPHLETDFVVLLADVYMTEHLLPQAIDRFRASDAEGLLGCKYESDPALLRQNFSVEAQGSRVVRVVEKPSDPRPGLKGVGSYVFSQSIFEAIERTTPSRLRNELELTDAIQRLVDTGAHIECLEVTADDINVNDAYSLLRANLEALKVQGLERLVADSVSLGPDVELRQVVIGRMAKICPGARLVECLVLPGAEVATRGPHYRKIFTPYGVVDVGAGAPT